MGAAVTSTEPVVSIVTVVHNAREMLLKGLAALQAGTQVPTEMIVVDNGSTDNTAAAVRHAYPEVTLVRRDEAGHPLAAANLGAARARAPWLLLLDPGLGPVGDAIRTLLEHAGGDPSPRLYTGRTLSGPAGHHGRREDDGRTVEGPPSLWGTACLATGLPLDPERLPRLDRMIGGEVPAVTPRVLLAERTLWEELGGFDERLPAADLSVRALALGARPVLVPSVQLVGLAEDEPARSARPALSAALLAERMAFAHRHWTPARARMAAVVLSAGVLARAAFAEPWRQVWRDRSWWLAPVDGPLAPLTLPRRTGPRHGQPAQP
jgi:N-acetylglucosaminyl-diphospho-decaprenol L-rhamnosyltransferase